MRFSQIDRILEVEPGESLTAIRVLALSEEYLKDHFPRFPVMPGVLMVEAVFQAAMFLVRMDEEFEHSMVVLEEAKNLKFQGFVQPGDQLMIHVQVQSREGNSHKFRVRGEVLGRTAVSGSITIGCFNLADRHLADQATDDHMRQQFRRHCRLLFNQLPVPQQSGSENKLT